jgi:hypothetical protein
MKRHWVEYAEAPTSSPMTGWIRTDGDPRPVPGKGFPVYHVQYGRFTFRFSSLGELDACIATLGQKVMPTSRQLSAGTGALNSHWLSRLPANVKPWRYRSKAVEYMKQALAEFHERAY